MAGLQTARRLPLPSPWWEVARAAAWRTLACRLRRGVCSRPSTADVHLVIDWERRGDDTRRGDSTRRTRRDRRRIDSSLRTRATYFRSGLTWPRRTQTVVVPSDAERAASSATRARRPSSDGDDARIFLRSALIINSARFRLPDRTSTCSYGTRAVLRSRA